MHCLASTTQKIVLYETKSRFYVVGSNNNETCFRVLKIDRTEPYDLLIHDDKVEYSRNEIKDMLTMIDSGNRSRAVQRSNPGLSRTVSAYGIVGFVRFLEGYYMILITKRRRIALIGAHTIYKIEDTAMIYIPNNAARICHPDEPRYEKMFQNIDLSSNFYFSYSYALTQTIQYNMTVSAEPDTKDKNDPQAPEQTDTDSGGSNHGQDNHNTDGSLPVSDSPTTSQPYYKFVWNKYLLNKFERIVHTDWLLYITHGFMAQSNMNIFGKSVYLTLIARRSNSFAGTRFLKRGANSQGAVANEVETEQIVHDASITFLHCGRVTSFVQYRGSVPLFWSQDISSMVPKPPISLDKPDPYASVAGLHFNEVLKRYGAPIIVLNLVKTRENRRHEAILSDEFRQALVYLNQFLPPEHAIQYIGFDMARLNKRKDSNVLSRLAKISRYCTKQTGFFFYSRKNVHTEFWTKGSLHGFNGHKTEHGSLQTGVVRTNCVDCLDRTNTAQFALAKSALGYQLYALGVLQNPELDFETDCVRMLEDMFEDHGDTLALQYGGSQLVHRIKSYRKVSPWTSHSRDIMHTLSRYYSNYISDADKQHTINLFLGIFRPLDAQLNLWEMPTDFYMHNPDARHFSALARRSYSQWWDVSMDRPLSLPFSQEPRQESIPEGSNDASGQVSVYQGGDEEDGTEFYEYYKPYELTVLDELYSFNMTESVRDFMPKSATNYSPFSPRVRPERRHDQLLANIHMSRSDHEANPNVTGKDSTTSTGSEGSSSSSESSDTLHSWIDLSSTLCTDKLSEFEPDLVSLKDMPTTKEVYNFQVQSPARRLEALYKRYVDIGRACQNISYAAFPTTHDCPTVDLFAVSAFRLDSCYSVEPPPVSRHSKEIYSRYIARGKKGAGQPLDKDVKAYIKYFSYKFM